MAFAFAAGAVDTASYMALGRVFTANGTGNTLLLTLEVNPWRIQLALHGPFPARD